MEQTIITGNVFDKYNSKNPVFKYLMKNFMTSLTGFIDNSHNLNILEAGCGEGYLADIITSTLKNVTYIGFDIEDEIVSKARENCKNGNFMLGSIYELSSFKNQKFDYVLLSEVLEHVNEPDKALKTLSELNADKFIFSVPDEPIWRVLNILRFKYLKDLGNTPGHIQHWSQKKFKNLIGEYFRIIEFKSVFPWSMALCEKK